MYCFGYSAGLFLAFFILFHARHTFSISQDYLSSSTESDVCMTPQCVISAADVLKSLDETMDPCDDFYSFACGGWMKRHELSEEQSEIDLLSTTQMDLDRKLRDLLESKYKSSDPHFVKMIKDYYNSCADLDTLESEGSEPLKKLLNRLGGWPVVEGSQWDESTLDWIDILILLRKLGCKFNVLLEVFLDSDPRNESINTLYLGPPYLERLSDANMSLGLDDPQIAAYYRTMVKAAKMLGADESTSEKELLEALRFEMALIKIMSKNYNNPEEERNRTMNTIAELKEELPQVPWLKFINGILLVERVYENETIVNRKPDFLVRFADLITSTDKRVIANYILWRTVLESKDYLSEEWKEIEEDNSSKRSKRMKGLRWKKCLSELVENMDVGLASYYIRHYFSDESKDEAMVLMKYIHKEFLKILENNDWMDKKTKEKAEEKANAIKTYIGYPKELLNDTFMMKMYENLTITTDSYLENVLAFEKRGMDRHFSTLRELSEDLTRSSKFYSLIEVNAFYNPIENSIAIPASILHDAFYDKDRPKYMNFAVIGYIIGHEITHGFDNEGRNYDKDGKNASWWDKESDEHFRKKVKCIIDQYDNYTTDIGLKVNGEKTQNENIADNGGLKEAYLAYHSWIKDHGVEPLLPGVNYSQNQIFWISAAHVWCSKYEPETLKSMLVFDEHSPGKFRIIGPMSNLAEFSKDFNCSPDAPMNRKYKCEVW